MKRNLFIEHVCWFSGFTDTFLPTLQAACHSLHCSTSEHHIHTCAPSKTMQTCWNLTLKTTRNVFFQNCEKHRHHRSHIFFIPSAHEKTKGKDFGMPNATSSVSFLVVHSRCCLSTAASPERDAILVNSSTVISIFFSSSFWNTSLYHLLEAASRHIGASRHLAQVYP